MIGTALSQKEQVNILKKLDKCDVPWNCAHGRVSLGVTRMLLKSRRPLTHAILCISLAANNESH
jgi:DNA mismatch repair ATPase MutL